MHHVSADEFTDCVMTRTKYDTVMRMKLTTALLVAVPLLSLCIVLVLSSSLSEDGAYPLEDLVILGLFSFVMCMVIIMSFVLGKMVHRLESHTKRDRIWMRSLMDYADSYGANITNMSEMILRMTSWKFKWSVIISAFFFVVLVLFMFYFEASIILDPVINSASWSMLLISFLLILLQMLITSAFIFNATWKHSKIQSDFMDEFSHSMSESGLQTQPMLVLNKPMNRWLHAFLCIMTVGVWSIIILIHESNSMNHHIYYQWKYEEQLLSRIMAKENCSGIKGIETEGSNALVQFLKNVL